VSIQEIERRRWPGEGELHGWSLSSSKVVGWVGNERGDVGVDGRRRVGREVVWEHPSRDESIDLNGESVVHRQSCSFEGSEGGGGGEGGTFYFDDLSEGDGVEDQARGEGCVGRGGELSLDVAEGEGGGFETSRCDEVDDDVWDGGG